MVIKVLGTGSTGNCYLVNLGGGWLMLDCGVDLRKVVQEVNLNSIEFIFLSHHHNDHSRYFQNKRLFGLKKLDGSFIQDYHKIAKFEEFRGIYDIWCFNVEHGGVPNSGIVVKSHLTNECLLYVTDFTNCKWNLKKHKPTHILVECNYIREYALADQDSNRSVENIGRHLDLEGCCKFLDTLDLSECLEIILVHMSHNYGDESLMLDTISKRYGIKTGVAQKFGGVVWKETELIE